MSHCANQSVNSFFSVSKSLYLTVTERCVGFRYIKIWTRLPAQKGEKAAGGSNSSQSSPDDVKHFSAVFTAGELPANNCCVSMPTAICLLPIIAVFVSACHRTAAPRHQYLCIALALAPLRHYLCAYSGVLDS